ncbi:MAG: M50 family metallopeptidase [Candidatus Helarchaeota archaeon]
MSILCSIFFEGGIIILTKFSKDSSSCRNIVKGLNLVSFVGIISHEMGHYLACKVCNVEVTNIKLLRFNKTGIDGFVTVKKSRNFVTAFFIMAGPILLSSSIMALLYLYYLTLNETDVILKLIISFFLLSLLLGQLPSSTDMKNTLKEFENNPKSGIFTIGTLIGSITTFLIIVQMIGYFLAFIINVFVVLLAGIIIARTCSPRRNSFRKINAESIARQKTPDEINHKNLFDDFFFTNDW